MLNLIISTFPGLGLPPTIIERIESDATFSNLLSGIENRLPRKNGDGVSVTTVSNRSIRPSDQLVGDLLESVSDKFLSLRLSAPLLGGKGGFGSQLRADGGRMSSKKKKLGIDEHGSSRNLDGRRLRSVAEAKHLAQHMISKPEDDRKAKEQRRQRLEAIVESTEKKQEQIQSGQHVRLDGTWIEEKDRQREIMREAILAQAGRADPKRASTVPDADGKCMAGEVGSADSRDGQVRSGPSNPERVPTSAVEPVPTAAVKVYGWDDEDDLDEFMSSDEDEDEDTAPSEASGGASPKPASG